MVSNLAKSVRIPEIRNKILITAAILAVYRFLAHIPVPTVDLNSLKLVFEDSQLINFLNIYTGGGLKNLSIVSLGIGPYISASIFVQLLTMIYPKIEEMVREGTIGRQKINMYTQLLTFPIALLQGYSIYLLLEKGSDFNILSDKSLFGLALFIIIVTSGTYLLIWLAEIITEKGIGNGISILVFAGILSGLPGGITGVFSLFDSEQIFPMLMFLFVGLIVVLGVVFINESYRRIEVHYSTQNTTRGTPVSSLSYIPIKINQSGVFPIIFAVSLSILPSVLGGFLQQQQNPTLSEIGLFLSVNFSSSSTLYNIFYFLTVFAFTFFYTNVAFSPQKISDDIRRSGGFVPGVRPGRHTKDYLGYVINRLTFAGGIFLGLIAIVPSIVQNTTGISSLAIGGTGILIVVSVILETVKQLDANIISREYQRISR